MRDQSELIAKLVRAIREIDAKATPYGEDDDGFVTRYVMPVGPLHRALGLVAGLSESEGETVLGGVVFRVLLGDRYDDGQWDAVLVPQPSAEAGDTDG
jgi:hypothetical protein